MTEAQVAEPMNKIMQYIMLMMTPATFISTHPITARLSRSHFSSDALENIFDVWPVVKK